MDIWQETAALQGTTMTAEKKALPADPINAPSTTIQKSKPTNKDQATLKPSE